MFSGGKRYFHEIDPSHDIEQASAFDARKVPRLTQVNDPAPHCFGGQKGRTDMDLLLADIQVQLQVQMREISALRLQVEALRLQNESLNVKLNMVHRDTQLESRKGQCPTYIS